MVLKHNIQTSLKVFVSLLKKPTFLLTSLISAMLIFMFFRFFFDGDVLVGILLTEALTLTEKIAFLTIGFIPSSINEISQILLDPFAFSLILLSLTQGLVIGSYTEIAKQRLAKDSGINMKSIWLALFGSGCIACGGSIIAPLFTSFTAITATFFIKLIGNILLLVALALAFYGLHKTLQLATTVNFEEKS